MAKKHKDDIPDKLTKSEINWLKKMEEIKRIGIKNLEKGTPLYRFLKKQQREYRKFKELEKEAP